MPLPLIPLIVAGATAASAVVAGKKGYDSYQNMQETKELAQSLESKYKRAFNTFDQGREKTNKTFEEYGLLKLEILNSSMRSFVEAFSRIKNVEFTDEVATEEFHTNSDINEFIVSIEQQVITAGQVMSAGVASLAGGGLAAAGALGATTTFAAASTGTAINLLTGIAAKNATLAFLGGGALKAGGLGIAGGTMVLGGIAVAPALAIGSLIFAASTAKKLEEMYAKEAEVETEIHKLDSATNVMKKISSTTKRMHNLAKSTNELFISHINKMITIVEEHGNDFSTYPNDDKAIIHTNYKLAVIMRNILDATILDEEGNLSPTIRSVLKAERKKVKSMVDAVEGEQA